MSNARLRSRLEINAVTFFSKRTKEYSASYARVIYHGNSRTTYSIKSAYALMLDGSRFTNRFNSLIGSSGNVWVEGTQQRRYILVPIEKNLRRDYRINNLGWMCVTLRISLTEFPGPKHALRPDDGRTDLQ